MDLELSLDTKRANLYSSAIGAMSFPARSSVSQHHNPASSSSSSSSSSLCKPKVNQKRSVQFADMDYVVDVDDTRFCEVENTDMEMNSLGRYQQSIGSSQVLSDDRRMQGIDIGTGRTKNNLKLNDLFPGTLLNFLSSLS